MIPNCWYVVLESHEVKRGKPAAFKRLGEEMVFWRDAEGKIVAMRDLCPHRQARLSPGKLVNGNIQCAFHGFEYDREGVCQLIPANGRNGPRPAIFQCRTYPTQEAHGFIWLWYGTPRATYPPLPFFEGLEGYHYETMQLQWQTHYTRAIESLLDVSHLPFVHARTIGRGGKTLVNGPYTTLTDNKIRVWVSNQPDEGLPAIRPTEVPPPSRPANLRFNFPNLWQLWLAERFTLVQALVPIDDETTQLYVRTYHRLTHHPLLGSLIAHVSNLQNRFIIHEDQAIVESQHPKKSGLDVGDRFIPGDRPIALYLRHRRDLIEAAQAEQGAESEEEQEYHALLEVS